MINFKCLHTYFKQSALYQITRKSLVIQRGAKIIL